MIAPQSQDQGKVSFVSLSYVIVYSGSVAATKTLRQFLTIKLLCRHAMAGSGMLRGLFPAASIPETKCSVLAFVCIAIVIIAEIQIYIVILSVN